MEELLSKLVDFAYLLLTATLGVIIWIAKKAVLKLSDTQEEQTKAFNAFKSSTDVSSANYTNFVNNCENITRTTTVRLNSHAESLKSINQKQSEHQTLLSEHNRRLDKIERKVDGV